MVSQFLLPRVRGQLRLFSAPTSHTINRCLLQQRIISTTIPRRAASTSTGAISNLPQFGGKSLPGFPTSNATGFRDSIRQLRGGRPFSSLPNLSANWDGAIRNNARNVDASAGGKDSPLERLAASWENELAAGVLDGKVMMDSKAQSSGTPPLPSGTPPPPSGNANFSGKEGESAGSDEKSENSEKKGWFAETNDRVVGVWLLGSAGLVFGIVVLGGLTRLTESGLSITEWKPVTGALPPMNQADWEECFTKYKDSPEYRILNPNMNLEEFKFIYYMEWGHRLWGRFIGISFVLPAAYFIARGRVTKRMACSLVGIAGMIGFQGFIGWWMVKSGLHDDLFVTPGNAVPRVSQYRLTTHLAAAFTVYLAMLYSGLSVLKENKLLRKNAATISVSEISLLKDPRLIPIRRTVIGILVLTFITAMTGGLVAGLDAGLIYNEFPYMGTGLKPPNAELMDGFYARDKENFTDLWWRNLLENPSMVQFQHRCLAVTTFTAILAFWAFARYGRGGKIWKTVLTKKMRAGIDGSMHLVSAQAALGISTLIYMVPISLAAAHQAGSLALLTGLMVLSSRLSIPPYLAEAVSRRMQLEMSGITNGGKGGVEERTGTGSSPPARPNVSFRSIARGSGEALNPAVITRNMPPIPATSTASSESEKTTPVFKIRRFGLKPPPTFRASRLITSQPSDSSFTTTSSKPQPSDASSTSSLSKPEREDLVKYRPLIASEVPKVRLLLSKKAASARSAREKEEWAAKGKEPMEPGQWPKSVSVRSPETVKPFKRPPGPAREYF